MNRAELQQLANASVEIATNAVVNARGGHYTSDDQFTIGNLSSTILRCGVEDGSIAEALQDTSTED